MSRPWCEECHNTGEIDCYCGGDICICENYGSMPCPDCADEPNDDDLPDWLDDDEARAIRAPARPE